MHRLLATADVPSTPILDTLMIEAIRSSDTLVFSLLVIVNIVPSSLIISALMMEALRSPETSVLTGITRGHTPEDGILHSHRSENKSYIALTGLAL
jgi:hypothetical protein